MEAEFDYERDLARAQEKAKDAEENLGQSELRDAILERAHVHLKGGREDLAEADFRLALGKSIQVGKKMDIVFQLLNMSLRRKSLKEVNEQVAECKALLEKGGDWERRNKLKVYEALSKMMQRELKAACQLLLEAVPTFNSPEILPFSRVVEYAVLTGVIELSRAELKKMVLENSDITAQLSQLPETKAFLFSLYRSDYAGFFRSLVPVIEKVAVDQYLGPHKKYFVREVRVTAYNQFLESYKTVTLESMARSFGVRVDFLDRELSELIAAKRISSRIDKIAGVVETESQDQRSKLYGQFLKAGDHLLNRVQRLSRLLDI